jgi:hypothetical protein
LRYDFGTDAHGSGIGAALTGNAYAAGNLTGGDCPVWRNTVQRFVAIWRNRHANGHRGLVLASLMIAWVVPDDRHRANRLTDPR